MYFSNLDASAFFGGKSKFTTVDVAVATFAW